MRNVAFVAVLLITGLSGCNRSGDWEKALWESAECGNNVREIGEICDGMTNLSCARFDSTRDWQPGGAPGCSQSCRLTQGTCTEAVVVNTCGNHVLDDDEPCDGTLFADSSQTCETFLGSGATGSLGCESCRVSVADCAASSLCGNGQVDAGERCDGSAFGNESCETLLGVGYSGELSCIGCATIDTTLCVPGSDGCGNGVLDAGEECDDQMFFEDVQVTCDEGKVVGTLVCGDNCAIDTDASCVDWPPA